MFFTPKITIDERLYITANTAVSIADCIYRKYVSQCVSSLVTDAEDGLVCKSLTFVLGIPEKVKEKIEKTAPMKNDPEEYVLDLGAESFVYATAPEGFLRAVSTLMQMNSDEGLKRSFIYDYPACSVRGYRVYMPGMETFEEFKQMIDFIVYYKYSSIILEVGGAMEYKRHPLINEKWVEFCKECSKYSGRSEEIQSSQQWEKDSIHYENGDGAYLSQEKCRELAEYCRERGIEIIPECPTLSHTDYICHAYPEIAERQNDPYPDTYCPANPKSYEIVFDILDEVIEVFNPKRINIGHDEFYSVAICDKCKGKSKSSIFAEDVKKISEYLASKGVETMIWGEKLLKARFPDGRKIGGWYEESLCNGVKFRIPEMFDCADKMPKGVTYLHWYWEFGDHLDDEYHSRNYPVVFGNFSALGCVNYRARINRGVKGGFVSNWGSNAEEYMQRNGQYLTLVTTGYALWSDTYNDSDKEALMEKAKTELYRMHNSKIKNPIRVRHYANYLVDHPAFWCGIFITDDIYLLGNYRVTYSDGTVASLPVKFGTNIGPRNGALKKNVTETLYSTLPIEERRGYTYEHLYENPYPEKKIEKIEYKPASGKENITVNYEFFL